MDQFLDDLWINILTGMEFAAALLDRAIAPLERLGPAWVIFFLALFTVGVTQFLVRVYRTRRHAELKQEFLHWQSVREAAMTADDTEKGRAMARNIDQAKLNKAYYDYFFEGLMKNLVTVVLPILAMVAYLSRTYPPERLQVKFKNPWIFIIGRTEPFQVGALFWFILCLLAAFAIFGVSGYFIKRGRKK